MFIIKIIHDIPVYIIITTYFGIYMLQLFLMHIDDFVSNLCAKEPYGGLMGSTSICCDEPSKVILGHSQDFASDAVNLSYIGRYSSMKGMVDELHLWKITKSFYSSCSRVRVPAEGQVGISRRKVHRLLPARHAAWPLHGIQQSRPCLQCQRHLHRKTSHRIDT